ncbi:MAG: FKBP-type peptidyl-prolyl cis-trans isomerase [Terracidiphilus sp.]
MKYTALILMLAASTAAASAQAPAKPAAPAAAKPATARAAAKSAAPAAKTAPRPAPNPNDVAPFIKAPDSIPQFPGDQQPVFTVALRYQDIEVGTGAVAEPGKLYKVLYTGYRASDGVIFDSTDKRPRPPVLDKDNKPVLGEDGKPQQGPVQPMPFPQGKGSVFVGFDQGFNGMKVGGKRRIFIPWQLAYGLRDIPDHGPDHPAIPAKSDLIFDITLVEQTDMPAPPARPNMPPGMHSMPNGQQMPPKPGGPGRPGAQPPAPGAK